jgi:magnesium-transporting ATPase (P-type)
MSDARSSGLTSTEAAARLAQYGPNEVETGRRFRVLREGLGLLANPLVLILLVAAIVSGFLGEAVDALEKSLVAIERGVIEGRKSFGNITKYLLMTLSPSGSCCGVPRRSGAVPRALVHRITRNTDPGHLRDTYGGKSVQKPAPAHRLWSPSLEVCSWAWPW